MGRGCTPPSLLRCLRREQDQKGSEEANHKEALREAPLVHRICRDMWRDDRGDDELRMFGEVGVVNGMVDMLEQDEKQEGEYGVEDEYCGEDVDEDERAEERVVWRIWKRSMRMERGMRMRQKTGMYAEMRWIGNLFQLQVARNRDGTRKCRMEGQDGGDEHAR